MGCSRNWPTSPCPHRAYGPGGGAALVAEDTLAFAPRQQAQLSPAGALQPPALVLCTDAFPARKPRGQDSQTPADACSSVPCSLTRTGHLGPPHRGLQGLSLSLSLQGPCLCSLPSPLLGLARGQVAHRKMLALGHPGGGAPQTWFLGSGKGGAGWMGGLGPRETDLSYLVGLPPGWVM